MRLLIRKDNTKRIYLLLLKVFEFEGILLKSSTNTSNTIFFLYRFHLLVGCMTGHTLMDRSVSRSGIK